MRVVSFALILALLTPTSARAHALLADYSLKNGTIHIEAYFDDDSPARNAHVLLQDDQQKTIAEGTTDSKGFCTLKAPPPSRYVLTVDAGTGHRRTHNIDIPSDSSPVKNDDVALASRRQEQTGFPLVKVAVGFGIIVLISLCYLLARQMTRP